MRDQTIENNGCEREYSTHDSNAVFLLSVIPTPVTIENAIPLSYFISDKLKGFFPLH